MASPAFTGEFFIPGASGTRLEADHLARYRYVTPRLAGRRVLDIACGSGYGSRLMAEAGADVTGVDLSEDALRLARADSTPPGLRFVRGDIETFTDEPPFDAITCFETIEHVPDPWAALANLHHLLAADGTLHISSPNRPITSPSAATIHDRPHNTFHVHEFTPSELVAALEDAGFVVDRPVLGQRRQPRLPRPAHRVWNKLADPRERARAEPRPLRFPLTARYFLLTARRRAEA